MTKRKQQLLEALIAYFIRHGVADVSLRPMAQEIGTSARLLIFHFRSRERLLLEVLDEMQTRMQQSMKELLGKAGVNRVAPLRMFWDWALEEQNFAPLRVLYQLQMLAAQDSKTYGKYLKRNSRNWLEVVQAILKPSYRSAALATLMVAIFDGLFIEVMSSGDRRRATAAIDQFVEMARHYVGARRSNHPNASS
jgi:AcrR family transcriptional regulator